MNVTVSAFIDYLNTHPKLPGGITHTSVYNRWSAYERKIWYYARDKNFAFPYVFWNDLRTAFYWQYRRVFDRYGIPDKLDDYLVNIDRDYWSLRSGFVDLPNSDGGTWDRYFRGLCVLRNDPLLFAEDSRIFQNITLVGQALDGVNEKITSIERLTRQLAAENARTRSELANIERTVKLRRDTRRAVEESGGHFDRAV